MVRRFIALLALLLACAAGGGTASAAAGAPAGPVAVTATSHGPSVTGGHGSGRHRAVADQHAAGVSATATHEMRPPLLPPLPAAGQPRAWLAPPLTGRVAESPRQGRAPPSLPYYSPRSTRGPPATTSS